MAENVATLSASCYVENLDSIFFLFGHKIVDVEGPQTKIKHSFLLKLILIQELLAEQSKLYRTIK